MKIAYVTLQGRGRTDELIAAVADRLTARGLRLAGTVQSNHDRPDRKNCDMDLRVLPDGPTVRISEDRGEMARGCILDSGALEQTVFEVERRLDGAWPRLRTHGLQAKSCDRGRGGRRPEGLPCPEPDA